MTLTRLSYLMLFICITLMVSVSCSRNESHEHDAHSSEDHTEHGQADESFVDSSAENVTEMGGATKELPVVDLVVEAESIDGAVHWVPREMEVPAGSRLHFTVKHELEGGFDFHGFAIRELGIARRVDRNKDEHIYVDVPADFAGRTLQVRCQFHPAHVAATLKVLDARQD